jgi:ABC-type multidrug transport system fused ATPase/permease subunit
VDCLTYVAVPLLPYRELPAREPGTPDLRSPWRFLIWLGRRQIRLVLGGTIFGVIWMVAQALLWAAVGVAIDKGLQHHSAPALWRWALVIVGLGLTQAVAGAIRHQIAVTNWMTATYRTVQLVGLHLGRTGVGVTDQVPPGDVVATVAADAMRIGGAFDVIPRFIGAIVAFLVVAIILLSTSGTLGLLVLVGVPVLASLTTPLMRPLHRTQAEQREAMGLLTAAGTDTVSGLRILRGIGGEDVFFANYIRISTEVRLTGNAVAGPQALLESGQVLLPAILTVIITWVGATGVLHHHLQPGQLVAFFGYATFLTLPLRTVIEYIVASTRAVVGARKVIAILATAPAVATPAVPLPWPTSPNELADPVGGVRIHLGGLIGLVAETPAAAQHLVDQLARFTPTSTATLDGTPLSAFALDDVRRHIVVSEIEPRIFAGTIRSEVDLTSTLSDEEVTTVLHAAGAEDILSSADDGLAVIVEERGRNFSGGQRQRLALARALATDADVLFLIEPTSAVDTHTESRIAQRLRDARAGRSTIIATTSPLLLEMCDQVIFVGPNGLVASGTHRELAATSRDYTAAVLRTDLS